MRLTNHLARLAMSAALLGTVACGDDDSQPTRISEVDSGSNIDADSGTIGDADSSLDSDIDSGSNADADTDDGCTAGGNWFDTETRLCWQNPASDADKNWSESRSYCSGLSSGGHDDWRMPKVHELVSLIRGCVKGVATGDLSRAQCDVSDPGCLDYGCDEGCSGCSDGEGPGESPDGCYWDPAVEGVCGRYWTSSTYSSDPTAAWLVEFDNGNSGAVQKVGAGVWVRCVRP